MCRQPVAGVERLAAFQHHDDGGVGGFVAVQDVAAAHAHAADRSQSGDVVVGRRRGRMVAEGGVDGADEG
ncbi:MAG TPA: hypothetical protein VEB64_17000 [Azospirillaceae bacterium]|nr:hypothetical protein [Azospirillaceae bacterium]